MENITTKNFEKPIVLETIRNDLLVNGEHKITLPTPRMAYQIPILQEAIKTELEPFVDQELFNMVLSASLVQSVYWGIYEDTQYPKDFDGNAFFQIDSNMLFRGYLFNGTTPFSLQKQNIRDVKIVRPFNLGYENLDSTKTKISLNKLTFGDYAVFIPQLHCSKEKDKVRNDDFYLYALSALIEEKEKVNFTDVIKNKTSKKIVSAGAHVEDGYVNYTLTRQSLLVDLNDPKKINEVIQAQDELYSFVKENASELLKISEITYDLATRVSGNYKKAINKINELNETTKKLNSEYGFEIAAIDDLVTKPFETYAKKEIDSINVSIDKLRPKFPTSFIEVAKSYGVIANKK